MDNAKSVAELIKLQEDNIKNFINESNKILNEMYKCPWYRFAKFSKLNKKHDALLAEWEKSTKKIDEAFEKSIEQKAYEVE